jgi:hypothetical protein
MTGWQARVYPHGALPRSPLPRNMVVYRCASSDRLLILSGVALDATASRSRSPTCCSTCGARTCRGSAA